MFSAAVLMAALAHGAAAAAPLGEGPGQQPLDAVRALLKATQAVTVFDHVAASATGGVVTLTGKVTSTSKRDQLETEVATVPGVRQVVNRIGVLSSSAADDALRHRVARAIYGHASFRRYAAMTQPPIRILVDGGRVTLAGDVRTAVERLVAVSLAEEAAGSRVDDQINGAGVFPGG
ncbi:MAG TPA: BON domain-containing protein [Vicinamibacterales bacterium]|nr:BON domain-containing protein [Vicinamibacterales bacterium]